MEIIDCIEAHLIDDVRNSICAFQIVQRLSENRYDGQRHAGEARHNLLIGRFPPKIARTKVVTDRKSSELPFAN